MTVHCPHCLTGYLLPEHLLGAGGARVRCPACEGVFEVFPEGEVVGEATGTVEAGGGKVIAEATSDAASESSAMTSAARPERRSESAPNAGSPPLVATATVSPAHEPPHCAVPAEPAMVAGQVLDVLADFLGDALGRSRARGTVLSDHGPAIIAVWDEYRRRAGAEAPTTIFRAALRDRCGVDLSHVNGD